MYIKPKRDRIRKDLNSKLLKMVFRTEPAIIPCFTPARRADVLVFRANDGENYMIVRDMGTIAIKSMVSALGLAAIVPPDKVVCSKITGYTALARVFT
ncbi:hypothetical protein [Duganella caerulea]|uniref:hypothetical protein n=1 Tax=Duganella caerulea TaxID=2885762 RepID=UPI004037971B